MRGERRTLEERSICVHMELRESTGEEHTPPRPIAGSEGGSWPAAYCWRFTAALKTASSSVDGRARGPRFEVQNSCNAVCFFEEMGGKPSQMRKKVYSLRSKKVRQPPDMNYDFLWTLCSLVGQK